VSVSVVLDDPPKKLSISFDPHKEEFIGQKGFGFSKRIIDLVLKKLHNLRNDFSLGSGSTDIANCHIYLGL
jgi:hypothetical protein